MNVNDYGSLSNKNAAADSGLYGNGSVTSRPQQPQGYACYTNSYPPRANGATGSYPYQQQNNRAVYASATPTGTGRNDAYRNNTYSGYQAPRSSTNDASPRASASGGEQSYRTNYGAAKQNGYANGAGGARYEKSSGTKIHTPNKSTKSGGNGFGNGNGTSGGNGNGKKPGKKKSLKQRFLAWLKKFLRSIYLLGKPMRIFL
ncbi:MAG: hypothetical protein PHW41_01360, partial [Eubacteriales bacterium]|nr:hypothetical protein [Eubacteriales bacterium]